MTIIFMLLVFLRIIFSKSNPNKHIDIGHLNPKGLFYLGNLNAGWCGILSDAEKIKIAPSFNDYSAKFSEFTEVKNIEDELIYELLKVSYIREIKLRRTRYLIKAITVALVLSLALLYLHYKGLSEYMH